MMKGTTREETIRFWNESAETYSNRQQGSMPDSIVSDLVSGCVLTEDSDVCELGSGPGTYSARIAPHVRSLTCVDASENMMARLRQNTEGIGNIRTVLTDFAEYEPGKVYDVTVAALCPGTHTEESVRRMCGMTKGTCVYIMWSDMCWDEVYPKVWKRFSDEDYPDIRNGTILDTLDRMGMVYDERIYSERLTVEFPFETAVQKVIRSFARYSDVPLTEEDAAEYMDEYRDGDMFRTVRTNKMRVVTWSVPESDVVHDA